MAETETKLKPSLLLLARNLAIGAMAAAGGYYMVQTSEIVVVILGAGLLLVGPVMVLMPLFMGLPARGVCPQCGGTIETMSRDDRNLLCRGCDSYLDAGQGKLRRSDPNRVEAEPSFAAPSPWSDITLVVYPTVAFSASDKIQDWLTTKKGGVRVMEARWPQQCVVCGAKPARFDEMARQIAKPGNVMDTEIVVAAKGIPYCGAHKEGVVFERIDSATPGASGCFGLKFRSLTYRNAFMSANPWRFTWHQ